jgi:hypothetical protein
MPDGRVLVCGGGRFDDATLPTDQFSAEFFSPPYLFRGSRPAITSAPSQLSYGQSFTVNFTVRRVEHYGADGCQPGAARLLHALPRGFKRRAVGGGCHPLLTRC